MNVLITGLPDSGKSHFANKLVDELPSGCLYLNGDEVRTEYNDWDFSYVGRERQARRMAELAAAYKGDVIMDFICPTNSLREVIAADYVVWMDTSPLVAYEDTFKIFESPNVYDIRITSWEQVDQCIAHVANKLKKEKMVEGLVPLGHL